jgi:hypothetical protein
MNTKTTTTDPRCRSGEHCSALTSDGPAIVPNAGTLCSPCVNAIQKCLEELPHLALALHAFLGVSPSSALQSRIKSTPEPCCPINLTVDELINEIGDVVDRVDGLRVADLVRQPAMEFVLWVGDYPQRRQLDGVQRALDARRVHTRANAIIGFDRVWQRRHAPCWSCALPALGNWLGDSIIQCTNCEAVMTLTEYEDYCNELAK